LSNGPSNWVGKPIWRWQNDNYSIMQVFLGIILHALGGFASGSFYIPYKRVKGWAWESYWIIGGLASWLFVPFLAAWLTVPGFMGIIRAASADTLSYTYLMGLLWGIGGLSFGLSMRYLGMSLGMSVALGFCSAFGALIPPIYRDIVGIHGANSFTVMLGNSGGQIVLLGVLLCLIGIYVCGRAGMLKEADLSAEKQRETIQEFDLWKGLAVATLSGILSACFNFGIEAGKPLAATAVAQGCNPLFQNNVIFVVILWGGLSTNLVWSLYLNAKNSSFGDYANVNTPLKNNYFFAILAGTTWFLQFFFYGMGESKLGNGASSWILHMATIIITSNLWGIYFREWAGVSPRTFRTILMGIALVIASVIVVGIGNSL
jgi:L-rhamnose-H+ transport protein